MPETSNGHESGDPVEPLHLLASSDELDRALVRAASHGSKVILPVHVTADGRRSVVLEGPGGMPLELVEHPDIGRLESSRESRSESEGEHGRSLPAERYLQRVLAISIVVAAIVTGLLAHVVVEYSPHNEVSFTFLAVFCTLLAAGSALVGYPSGLIGGEADHQSGSVGTLKVQALQGSLRDGASGWSPWIVSLYWALGCAVAAAGLFGILSLFLNGRPFTFLLVWAWSLLVAGVGMVVPGAFGRRKGLLVAGRRYHGLPLTDGAPENLLRRFWLSGGLPVSALSAFSNAGLAWAAYRWGVDSHRLGSDLLASVVITAALTYLTGHQWGKADVGARRLEIPNDMHLPRRVRLGPQGVIIGAIVLVIVLTLASHILGNPPGLAGAVALRALAGLLAGAMGFALGAASGAVNGEAERRESAHEEGNGVLNRFESEAGVVHGLND